MDKHVSDFVIYIILVMEKREVNGMECGSDGMWIGWGVKKRGKQCKQIGWYKTSDGVRIR